jgi:hypothetical protein
MNTVLYIGHDLATGLVVDFLVLSATSAQVFQCKMALI